MSYLKTAHLQALYARRREAEHNRIERTSAINKYYDHWGKVTARFENWSTPEYYKQAEEQLQNTKDKKEKQKNLIERRERLAKLLDEEKKSYELEMKEQERSRRTPRHRRISTTTLEKIEENLKEQEKQRRKLELEAKLYGKWRHGLNDENLIFESKTDNEVLAKLNWLDKQVNQQLQREMDENAAKDRDLKMQQELNKTEKLQMERQQIREHEIKEMRALQEFHMQQWKDKQLQSDDLKKQENKFRTNLTEIQEELKLLEESYNVLKRPKDFGNAYNWKNIKIFIRKRSEEFRNHTQICISILERILDYIQEHEVVKKLLQKLQKESKTEHESFAQIEGMYESEAKYSLNNFEELRQIQHKQLYEEMNDLLQMECQKINSGLKEVMKKQQELIEIRATHLNLIDNSSEKLKQLIQEEENSPRFNNNPNSQRSLMDKNQELKNNIEQPGEESKKYPATSQDKSKLNTNSYDNLNLNGWETNTPLLQSKRDSISQISQHSLQVPTPEPIEARTKYGRKHYKQSQTNTIIPASNSKESDNNLSPKCYKSQSCYNINNSFKNLNLNGKSDSLPRNSQSSLQIAIPDIEVNRPRFGRKQFTKSNVDTILSKRNSNESVNNLPSRYYDTHAMNDETNSHISPRDRDDMRQNAQRELQVVTPETEANRPRFGRKHAVWN